MSTQLKQIKPKVVTYPFLPCTSRNRYRSREKTYEVPETAQPNKNLPTMYDLPSENQEEPGLPDDFHSYQPQLLRETFRPHNYSPKRFYVASDLNLYYDVEHPTWYKRPDWFMVRDVPQFYNEKELRMSYVVWQERKKPFLVVELLSESTKKEDLGITLLDPDSKKPPTKWHVYEHILRIPYYIVFSRDPDQFRAFQLGGRRYREIKPEDGRLWFMEMNLGLGLWHGTFQEMERRWLRWYDADRKWILTSAECAEQEKQRAEREKQRAEQEKQRAEQLAAQLKALGIEPNV